MTTRKRRTPTHVLCSRGIDYVTSLFHRCGHAVQPVDSQQDYGIDLLIFEKDASGYSHPGDIRIQVKARSKLRRIKNGQFVSFPVEIQHLLDWHEEIHPVFLIVFDGDPSVETAYYLYVQKTIQLPIWKERLADATIGARRTLDIHIPTTNVLNEQAVQFMCDCRERVFQQAKRDWIFHDIDD